MKKEEDRRLSDEEIVNIAKMAAHYIGSRNMEHWQQQKVLALVATLLEHPPLYAISPTPAPPVPESETKIPL
ncbi:MAG: hypothetical protein PHC88_05425 [Terrimicrobiaceae bacterium]|nr:hypothetical protein [Terrimicrobiaceae bacterium]